MKNSFVTIALTGILLTACSGGTSDSESAEAAAQAASKSASAAEKVDPKNLKPGQVYVAPVSKIASAPGVDPNKASSLPPMPKAAMFKGPVAGASAPASGK